MGFSTRTSAPAASARRAIGTCSAWGVATMMASGRLANSASILECARTPASAAERARAATAAALESAKGVLRSEVGKQTGVKFTPTLAFIPDAIPENAMHVEELLRAAAADDARVHAQAAEARFAGDPDPYRHPQDADAEVDEP